MRDWMVWANVVSTKAGYNGVLCANTWLPVVCMCVRTYVRKYACMCVHEQDPLWLGGDMLNPSVECCEQATDTDELSQRLAYTVKYWLVKSFHRFSTECTCYGCEPWYWQAAHELVH